MSKKVPKRQFDVHRTLSSHKPGQKNDIDLPPKAEPRSRRRRWLFGFLAVLLAALLFITSWDAINLSRMGQKLFNSGNLFSLMGYGKLNGTERGRVNVLLVGYSVDDPGHQAATLTDSIILLSMDTKKHTGYMLSIPRDLYVSMPGYGYGKINEAYNNGGVKLLKSVVSTNFKVPIDYYVLVNYSAVRNLVNAVGGIDVCIKSIDSRGLYDPNINKADGGPLKLKNGCQHLNGQTALNLTRARGDPSPDGRIAYGFGQADFDRTQHQRQVLAAIKAELSWKLILNPLQNGKIAQALAKNIKTDIRANQARPLFGLYNSIPEAKLQSIGLRDVNGRNYLASYNASGSAALIPVGGLDDYTQIQALIEKLNQR